MVFFKTAPKNVTLKHFKKHMQYEGSNSFV